VHACWGCVGPVADEALLSAWVIVDQSSSQVQFEDCFLGEVQPGRQYLRPVNDDPMEDG
jgi:hypothetical protein